MSELLSIRALRSEMDLTLAAFAARVGVTSKGYMSDIENGAPCSVKVALAIEALSGGRIAAARLSVDVALVDEARAGAHAQPDTAAHPVNAPGNPGEISGARVSA